MTRRLRIFAAATLALLLMCASARSGFCQGQKKTASQTQRQATSKAAPRAASGEPTQSPNPEAQKGGEKKNEGPVEALAEESREAAGEEGNQFKQSASVRWLAAATHLSPLTAYWIFTIINFAIVGLAVFAVMKSKLPGWFRTRTQSIQSGITEAQKSSEEARMRLAAIESRLARMDSEVAAMRAEAEQAAQNEEQRIRTASEEDKMKIIAAAEQEIVALSRAAQRELKAYAASLAVELAERRIQIDQETDRRLVRSFAAEFNDGSKG
jgi:F-type H+-transporting ATPase subunit b